MYVQSAHIDFTKMQIHATAERELLSYPDGIEANALTFLGVGTCEGYDSNTP